MELLPIELNLTEIPRKCHSLQLWHKECQESETTINPRWGEPNGQHKPFSYTFYTLP